MNKGREFFDNWRWTLTTIFIVALLIRGVFILTQQDGFYFPDSLHYSGAAVNLLTDGEFGERYNRSPGYPVFLAVVYALFGERIFAVRAVESVMGAILAVFIAILGRRIGGEAVGASAGILWSIYPIGVFVAGLVYPTGLAAMLLVCGAWYLLPHQHQDPSRKRAFCGGLFLGLAALTVPVVLATIMALTVWLLYWGRRDRVMLIFLVLLGSAVTIVPWTIRNFQVYGRIVFIEPRIGQYVRNSSIVQSRVDDKSAKTSSRKNASASLPNLRRSARHFGREFVHFWQLYPDRITMSYPGHRERLHAKDPRVVRRTIFNPNGLVVLASVLSTGPVFLFAIIGTAIMWLRRELRRHLAMFWAFILSFAIGYSFFYTQMRYRIPIEPYIMILSAYGLVHTWSALRQHVLSGLAFNPKTVAD